MTTGKHGQLFFKKEEAANMNLMIIKSSCILHCNSDITVPVDWA